VSTTMPAPEATTALPAYMGMDRDSLEFDSSAFSSFPFSPGPSLDVDYLDFMSMDSQTHPSDFLPSDPAAPSAADTVTASLSPLMDLSDSSIDPNLHQSLVTTDHVTTIDRPGSPADEGTITAYEKMAPICVSSVEPS
jgi:hypothetical protein